ncbi:MAG: hypothetical protein QGH60_25230, partial [Phycisphaerae bacterium]|nr:hypothetical protein [Phycisphaerae bacterium]
MPVKRGAAAVLVVAMALTVLSSPAGAAKTNATAKAAKKKARKARAKKPRTKKVRKPKTVKPSKPVNVSMGTPQSLRLAIEDLGKTYGKRYPAAKFIARLEAAKTPDAFTAVQREALAANPLLDFDKILLVKRPLKNAITAAGGALGLPTLNARVNDTIKKPGTGWEDTL